MKFVCACGRIIDADPGRKLEILCPSCGRQIAVDHEESAPVALDDHDLPMARPLGDPVTAHAVADEDHDHPSGAGRSSADIEGFLSPDEAGADEELVALDAHHDEATAAGADSAAARPMAARAEPVMAEPVPRPKPRSGGPVRSGTSGAAGRRRPSAVVALPLGEDPREARKSKNTTILMVAGGSALLILLIVVLICISAGEEPAPPPPPEARPDVIYMPQTGTDAPPVDANSFHEGGDGGLFPGVPGNRTSSDYERQYGKKAERH